MACITVEGVPTLGLIHAASAIGARLGREQMLQLKREMDHVELSAQEIRRYARHIIMPEVGLEGQTKLKEARVLLVGAGGLQDACVGPCDRREGLRRALFLHSCPATGNDSPAV